MPENESLFCCDIAKIVVSLSCGVDGTIVLKEENL